MHSLDYNNVSGDISIPIQSIFFKLAPDYIYKKRKTMTFIHETFDNFEKLLRYIATEDKFMKGQYNFTQIVKLEQIVRKLQKRIYRLKNYILEIHLKD
jgi:CCR4-NOT transcriptional regulation complex NOT5 subunit